MDFVVSNPAWLAIILFGVVSIISGIMLTGRDLDPIERVLPSISGIQKWCGIGIFMAAIIVFVASPLPAKSLYEAEQAACAAKSAAASAAMSEAMVLATKAGVDPEKVFQAIKGGLAGSNVLNAKVPLVLDGNFKPGFRIELHIKDLANALDTAHSVGVPVPLTGGVMEIMQALKVDGKGGNDHGGIIQYYEKLAKAEVRHQK